MLEENQKSAVAQWLAAGASLDEIQKRIKSDFGVHMTYLEVRLMVAELPQPAEPEPEEPIAEEESAAAEEEEPVVETEPLPPEDEGAGESEVPAEEKPAGQVSVAVDTIMIPGTLASGDVTFSDGKSGKWYLDQMGRLGLGKLPEGYRPSGEDWAVFQRLLMAELQARGL